MSRIIIKGKDRCVLSVTLDNILYLIDEIETYVWKINWLEANGSQSNLNILELEEKINHSEKGYLIEYIDLFNLISSVNQFIELELVGRYVNNKKYIDYTIKLELVDSSFWLVESNNEKFISDIIENLDGVEDY